MTNPVVLKHTLPMAALTVAQAIALPCVAAALLALEHWYFGAGFNQPYDLLLALVMMLGTGLRRRERGLMPRLTGGGRKLVVRLMLRWLILLFVLLMLG